MAIDTKPRPDSEADRRQGGVYDNAGYSPHIDHSDPLEQLYNAPSATESGSSKREINDLEAAFSAPSSSESGSDALRGSDGEKSIPANELRNKEEDPSRQKRIPSKPDDQERLRLGYTDTPPGPRHSKKKSGKHRFATRRSTVTGAVVGILLGGGVITSVAAPYVLGPMAAVHYKNILMKPFGLQDDHDSGKLGRFLWYSRTRGVRGVGKSAVASTRLTLLDMKVNDYTMADLKRIGVEFGFDEFGRLSGLKVEPTKNPAYAGLSDADAKSLLAGKLGVDESKIVRGNTPGSPMRVAVSASKVKTSLTYKFFKEQTKLTGRGRIASWEQRRVLLRYLDRPSAFHPFQKAKSAVDNKVIDLVSKSKAYRKAEETRAKAAAKISESGQRLLDTTKEKMNGMSGKVTGALLVLGAVCAARDVAEHIADLNQSAIVEPAMSSAADGLGVGGQAEIGDDVTLAQIGAYNENSVAPDGTSKFDSKDIRELAGLSGGINADEGMRQAFSYDLDAATIVKNLDAIPGVGAACSDVGMVAQAVVGLGFIVAGPGGWLAKSVATGSGIAAGAVAMNSVKTIAERFFGPKVVQYVAHQGALGGTMDALGARAAANLSSISGGGVILSTTQLAQLQQRHTDEEIATFKSQSLVSRLFDTNNERSLLYRTEVALATKPRIINDTPSALLSSVASLPSSIVRPFTKTSLAAVPSSYSIFPATGHSIEDEQNPTIQDPYDAGDKVAALFESASGSDYIDRSMKCFGAKIYKTSDNVWDAASEKSVNPASAEYREAKCNEQSNNMLLTRAFIDNTTFADAFLCSKGEEESCSKINNGSGTDDGSDSQQSGVTVDQANMYKDSSAVDCAPGTTDLGIQDGYHDGALVKIKVCSIPGFKSSASESGLDPTYGIVGANGNVIVNSRVSGAWLALFTAAKSDGVTLSSESSFRSNEKQRSLWFQFGQDRQRVAPPGYSNHQMGLAIDFDGPSAKNLSAQDCTSRVTQPGDPTWNWLEGHAAAYGFKQYSAESWHWDPDTMANRCGGGAATSL